MHVVELYYNFNLKIILNHLNIRLNNNCWDSMTREHQIDDTIDLIKIFQLMWKDKLIIIGITFLSFLGAYFYLPTQDPRNYVAYTEIRPISIIEDQKYFKLNSYINLLNPKEIEQQIYSYQEINFEMLYDLYLEQLKPAKIFEDAIVEFQLIDRKVFENDKAFDKAVTQLASNIKLVKPKIKDINQSRDFEYWKIMFSHTNENKWKDMLSSIDLKANDNIMKILKQRINENLLIEKQKRDFKIDDVLLEIDNALLDYDTKTSNLVFYLEEQSAIAKKLGIVKSTIESQMFSASNGMLNIEFETPFYLKGYEAIDEEIELITSRENKNAFVEGLLEKQNEIRKLKQDKTIKRMELAYESTPILTDDNFFAAHLQIESTRFNYANNDLFILIISTGVGGLLGVFYVIIINAFRKRDQMSTI